MEMSQRASSLYPTFMDPLTQNILGSKINEIDVLLELKTHAIFFDIVSPSVSHVLSSTLTFNALKYEPELLQEGIIQPQLPASLDNVFEYVNWSNIENELELIKKFLGISLTLKSFMRVYLCRENNPFGDTLPNFQDPIEVLNTRLRFLDENVRHFWKYDQPKVAEIVKRSIEIDLDPKESLFSKEFKSPHDVIMVKEIASSMLKDRGVLDRYLLFMYIDKRKLSDAKLLKTIINSIYFSSGTLVMNHMFGVSPVYIPIFTRKLEKLNSLFKEYLVTKKAFDALLGNLHVVGNYILNLDVDGLKQVRRYYKKHVQKDLQRIVEKWQKGMIESEEINITVTDSIPKIESELNEVIKSEITKQKKFYSRSKKVKEYLRYSANIATFFGTVFSSKGIQKGMILLTLGETTRLLAEPIFQYLIDKHSNFIVFSEMLKRK